MSWFKKSRSHAVDDKNFTIVPAPFYEIDQNIKILEEELNNSKGHKHNSQFPDKKLAEAVLRNKAINAATMFVDSASELINMFIEKSKFDKLINLQLSKMQIEAHKIYQEEDNRFKVILESFDTLKKTLDGIIQKALLIDPGSCSDKEFEFSKMLIKEAGSKIDKILDIVSKYI